jgi:hypothetical protein
MDHIRLVNALTKAGATVTKDEHHPTRYQATKGERYILWFTQDGYPKPERLAAVCVHTPSPHTDVMTDCFCDTYHDTIKGAVHALTREGV